MQRIPGKLIECMFYWDEQDVAYSTSNEDLLNFKGYVAI